MRLEAVDEKLYLVLVKKSPPANFGELGLRYRKGSIPANFVPINLSANHLYFIVGMKCANDFSPGACPDIEVRTPDLNGPDLETLGTFTGIFTPGLWWSWLALYRC